MWTQVQPGRWSRDEGYLLSDGDLMLELHGDTLHIYRRNPKADPKLNTGGPLDGYRWQSTEPAREASTSPPAVDAPTAWRVLSERAATAVVKPPSTRAPSRQGG